MGQPTKIEEISQERFCVSLCQKADRQRVPVQPMIELTYGCNLRCVHCHNPTHTAKNELSTEQVCQIIDQLAQQGGLYLAFTGGELFTRRDCFGIFAYAKERGFRVSILTNATLITPEKADRIQTLGPHRVEISIYGATAETYERVTRVPGSYRRFVQGVHALRERHLPMLIKMPVMTLNLHEVDQAKALVEGWGIRFVYSTEIHPRVDGSREPLDYRLAPRDCVRLHENLTGYQQWSAEGGREQGEPCGGGEGLFTCKCGRLSLAVTPYGQLNLCTALPTPRYDLRTGTVADGWTRLVELVDEANARPGPAYECPSCDLRPHCRQGPMDAYLETGDLSPCLPFFKELAALEKEAGAAAGRRADPGRP